MIYDTWICILQGLMFDGSIPIEVVFFRGLMSLCESKRKLHLFVNGRTRSAVRTACQCQAKTHERNQWKHQAYRAQVRSESQSAHVGIHKTLFTATTRPLLISPAASPTNARGAMQCVQHAGVLVLVLLDLDAPSLHGRTVRAPQIGAVAITEDHIAPEQHREVDHVGDIILQERRWALR